MSITDLSSNEKVLIKVNGDSVDSRFSGDLKKLCLNKISSSPKDIYLDFSDVKFLDSSSIGVLLVIIQTLKTSSHKVIVEKHTPELKELFKSLLIDQFLVLQ